MKEKKMENIMIMSDAMFLGAFDADGSILLVIDDYTNDNNRTLLFDVSVKYDFTQSNSKSDLVEKIAAKFYLRTTKDKTDTSFRITAHSKEAMYMRALLLKNKPLYPGRRRDFLLSEEIILLKKRKAQLTKQGLITLVMLAYQNYANIKFGSRKTPISYFIESIKASQSEYESGVAEANLIIDRINAEVKLLEETLPTTILPLNYIRGAHVGDGGFTVSLTWKPTKDDGRRTEPSWTISGENLAYCQAFVYTLGGLTNLSGPNCHTFRLMGKENLKNVFYIFEETWMPQYKVAQFQKLKEIIRMLYANEHYTIDGLVTLVELAYDMSEKGSRQYSKQQYIDWGVNWLNKKDRRLPSNKNRQPLKERLSKLNF